MYAALTRSRGHASNKSTADQSSGSSGRSASRGVPIFLRASASRDHAAHTGPRAAIGFPHASSIQSATGTSIPGSAIHDPDACARRGVPAFTDGSVTHFASQRPALHVAAHEAAHQLQHSGHTNDAGMGAEGHAHSVANSIASGASARPFLGDRGRRVAPALRHYTDIPDTAQTATGQWVVGSTARVADTGSMVTLPADGHVCYAEASLIDAANAILRAKRSGVRLRAGAAGPRGDAPDGSGAKSTVEVIPQVSSATASGENWSDCGRMSREVQGGVGADTPARGFFRDGGGTEHETSATYSTTRIRDEALVGAGLGTDAATARAAYDAMTPAQRDAFDAAHGFNRYAAPNVGESYMSVRDDAQTTQNFNFHWGGVVMASGGDRVTFENFYRAGLNYDSQNQRWYFDMYGPPAKPGQTWHDRWAEGGGREGSGVGEPGMGSMTIPTRTSLSTAELITHRANATQVGEQMALDAEMADRWIKVTVVVVSAQEDPDEVYVRGEHDGRSYETSEVDMSTGDRGTFWIPLRELVPVTGAVHIRVYDSDLLADDDISALALRDVPSTDNRPYDNAEYHTTAEFDR